MLGGAVGSAEQQGRAVRLAGVVVLLLAACVAAVAVVGGGGRARGPVELFLGLDLPKSGSASKINWGAFDQQLAHDYKGKLKAAKSGHSSSELAHAREQELTERHLLAQKRFLSPPPRYTIPVPSPWRHLPAHLFRACSY